MANSDKDILITPNKGTTSLPEVSFVGQVNSPIKLRVLDDNTLSFEGTAGQLFSINNNLTSGLIFAASDVSGVPSLSVNANGYVNAVPYNGVLTVGGTTTNGSTSAVTLDVRGRAPGGADPVALSSSANGSLIISASGTGVLAHLGIQANTTPQYAWMQVRHSTNGSAYNLTLQPLGGYTGFYEKPISRVSVATDGTSGDSRQLTIYNKGQSLINFGSYPASWSPALMIQNNNNTDFVWISPLDDTYNARFRTGGCGLDFYTGGGNDSGTLALQLDTSGNVGVKGSTNGSYALNVTGNFNVQGELYKNGVLFNPLPAHSASTIGAVLMSNGTSAFWDVSTSFPGTWGSATGPTNDGTVTTLPYNAEDRYRVGFQISRGYAMAGYKDSVSYKNVCSINHGTITLANHGDLLTNGQGYCAGAQNLSMQAYVFIAVNGVGGTGSTCSKINMNTNTNAGTTSINNNRSATSVMRRDFRFAYVYGGGDSRPSKFNLNNDSCAFAPNGNPAGDENNPAGAHGATYGWSKKNGGYLFSWANETFAAWPNSPGTDGSNKTLSARHGYNYWNTAGGYRTSANLSKRSSYTGTEANQVGKFECGEETFHTGMDKGFMCGMYDGAQKNTGAILNYAAETFVANSAIDRVGPPGSASGAGAEYGSVLTGYDGI